MAYTKPTTYVTGTAITAQGQRANDDDARRFVNQGIRTADLEDASFDYDSLERGELCPIDKRHTFLSGDVYGSFTDGNETNRAYFTSLTKANGQLSSVQYQDIYGTGHQFEVYSSSDYIMYTFGATFISAERQGPGPTPGPGQYSSAIRLKLVDESDGTEPLLSPTLSYTFEESSTTASGTEDPGSTSQNCRRWIGFQYMFQLNPGIYSVSVAINPRVEEGYCSNRQFSMEIFRA